MKKLILIPALALATLATGAVAEDEKKDAATENYKEADADGDGKLTKKEFRKFIDLNAEDKLGRAAQIKSYGMYDRAFGRIDADGDGFVTPDEMKAMSQR